MPANKINKERDAAIVESFLAGENRQKIAEKHGISVPRVYHIAKIAAQKAVEKERQPQLALQPLGKLLKEWRKRRQISAVEAAELLRVPILTYFAWERNQTDKSPMYGFIKKFLEMIDDVDGY